MIRFCQPCRTGDHNACTGTSIDSPTDGEHVPCPCRKHAPQPLPTRCTACGRAINPLTGECAGCSD